MKAKKLRKLTQSGTDQTHEEARKWHMKLFPEEYDCILDDWLDNKLRNEGANPIPSDYIDRVNSRRAKIGLKPYTVGQDDQESYMWIKNKY